MTTTSCLGIPIPSGTRLLQGSSLEGSEGVGQAEASFVECAADDGATTSERSDGAQVVDRPDARGGDDLAATEGDQRSQQVHVRAGELAVPLDGRDLEGP